MTIMHARISDAGTVEVIARNSEGEVHANASLDVFQHEVQFYALNTSIILKFRTSANTNSNNQNKRPLRNYSLVNNNGRRRLSVNWGKHLKKLQREISRSFRKWSCKKRRLNRSKLKNWFRSLRELRMNNSMTNWPM